MDNRNNGASAEHEDEDVAWDVPGDDGLESERDEAAEAIGRELASFAFLREEDDREVRLHFRDVPADEVARAFQRAGALYISMTGERARPMQPPPATPPAPVTTLDTEDDIAVEDAPPRTRRRRKRRSDPSRPQGELTVRYFFATPTLVYTVIITTSTGMMQSIGSIFPSAQLSERELQTRLSATFR